MTYDRTLLEQELTVDEGLRLRPYRDTKGLLTIGIGHNLDGKGISKRIASALFAEDIADSEADLDKHCPWWRQLSDARQRAMLNLVFNMGWGDGSKGLSSFRHTLKAIELGDWTKAAAGLKGSKWYQDVGPGRGDRLIHRIVNG